MFRSKANRNAKTSSRAFESRLHGIEQLEHKQLLASLTGDAVDTGDHAGVANDTGYTFYGRYLDADHVGGSINDRFWVFASATSNVE